MEITPAAKSRAEKPFLFKQRRHRRPNFLQAFRKHFLGDIILDGTIRYPLVLLAVEHLGFLSLLGIIAAVCAALGTATVWLFRGEMPFFTGFAVITALGILAIWPGTRGGLAALYSVMFSLLMGAGLIGWIVGAIAGLVIRIFWPPRWRPSDPSKPS